MYSSMSSICFIFRKNRGVFLKIAIISGNLESLFLSHLLLDNSNYNITIFEPKAEIGFPTSGSGILKKGEIINSKITSWIPTLTIQPNIIKEKGYSYRRDWLEKDLSLSLLSKEVRILVKTTIISQTKNNLEYISSKGKKEHWQGDIIIDLSSNEKSDELFGVISEKEQPDGWQRTDGTWEGWYQIIPDEIIPIQLIQARSNIFFENTIDSAFEIAQNIFNTFENC
jgi:hypothetical protein